ncbi:hypothetical protein J6590_037066 [Homalodisca vitripennis]|nr:hypothetical protein J6590_037066 [Homalodisca vitripennis]
MHGATSIKINLSIGNERLCLLAVYRSPSPDLDLQLFIQDLEVYCNDRPRDRMHWINLGEFMGTSKSKETFPVEHFLSGNTRSETDNILEAADQFNEYYANVGSNLENAIPPVTEVVVNDENYQIDSVFQFSPFSLEQLEKSVLELKGGSAPGVDGIHTKVIKRSPYG